MVVSEETRKIVLRMKAQSVDYRTIAETCDVSVGFVATCIGSATPMLRRPGRPGILNDRQKTSLLDLVKSKPFQDIEQIRAASKSPAIKRLHSNSLRSYLSSLGCSYRPAPAGLPLQDHHVEARKEFMKKVKKNAGGTYTDQKAGQHLCFIDRG